ncbi:hypothetical protein GFC05_10825 [Cronobacter sakazakii]|uniref:Uncharacterized protein n=1 Tax=Cronobacter sakazakii (strain ATCC BAA-894) TaxID=290339 RepID=A7MKT8_CROS8|nr:hypothetical protein ESA_04144 [Cronobacter sakazakii ATCC BAA-894]QGG05056.1 hypothetical protein GFC05_10825 [Cronobacter sakazakii]
MPGLQYCQSEKSVAATMPRGFFYNGELIIDGADALAGTAKKLPPAADTSGIVNSPEAA